jgi:hypothetical protein
MLNFNAMPIIPMLTAKDPNQDSDWLIDFTNTIMPADTIASIISVVTTPTSLIVAAFGIVPSKAGIAGLGVGLRLTGGTAGIQYNIKVTVLTVGGNIWPRSIIVPCANR